MNHSSRIYVAGHRGLVGSAIMRALQARGYDNIVTRTHKELDLLRQKQVEAFFDSEKPEFVFLAAAKVGGILANATYPADFIYQNLAIQSNVIHSAWKAGVRGLAFLGSSCIYPRDCHQPIKEEYLLTGPLEPTNRPYALAKIAGIEQCWSYNRQYGTHYFAVMPTNLFGPGDNYDLEKSHVIPALIRKMHEAKTTGSEVAQVWGTGTPRREFLYSNDMADAVVFLMENREAMFARLSEQSDVPPLINVGAGKDITIAQLAALVAEVTGFNGKIVFDTSKPDGTPQKLLDTSLVNSLGWQPSTELRAGLFLAYEDYLGTVSAP